MQHSCDLFLLYLGVKFWVFISTCSLERQRYLPAWIEQQRAEARWEQRVEERSAPLRSGSMFFGDLAAVNLKVDHFSLVSFSSAYTRYRQKGIIMLWIALLKNLLAIQSHLSARKVQEVNFQMQTFWLYCAILPLMNISTIVFTVSLF